MQKEELKEMFAEIVKSIVSKEQYGEQLSEEDGYYTRDELCEFLHITYTTLWRMEKRGTIIAHKIGRRNLYSKVEIKALLASGTLAKKME